MCSAGLCHHQLRGRACYYHDQRRLRGAYFKAGEQWQACGVLSERGMSREKDGGEGRKRIMRSIRSHSGTLFAISLEHYTIYQLLCSGAICAFCSWVVCKSLSIHMATFHTFFCYAFKTIKANRLLNQTRALPYILFHTLYFYLFSLNPRQSRRLARRIC